MIKLSDNVSALLTTLWQNYNCAVKLPARLKLIYEVDGKVVDTHKLMWDPVYATYNQLAIAKAPELIKEFVASWKEKEEMPPLNTNNAVFPEDKGKYPPTMIMVPDILEIYASSQTPPWSSWRSLIRHFEDHPEYGVRVSGGPVFHNKTYGDEYQHLSRVWFLIPSYNEKYFSGGKFDQFADKVLYHDKIYHTLSPLDKAELKKSSVKNFDSSYSLIAAL